MTAKRINVKDLPDWPGLLSPELAAAYCAMSLGTFDAHIRPQITERHFGASVRFSRADLDKFIDSDRVNGEGSRQAEDKNPWDAGTCLPLE
ncbi:MAG: transcriptional regulator [Gammaproteobacteria bacterium]|nr:transcriptional regulator [Gammaproteobacteria bacterium]